PLRGDAAAARERAQLDDLALVPLAHTRARAEPLAPNQAEPPRANPEERPRQPPLPAGAVRRRDADESAVAVDPFGRECRTAPQDGAVRGAGKSRPEPKEPARAHSEELQGIRSAFLRG